MRQIGITEKVDPLTRIQDEIKEVARREQELRELLHNAGQQASAPANDNALHYNGTIEKKCTNIDSATTSLHDDTIESSQTPSLSSSVNSKESLDEHNSDDSGISASSSPVNGTSANNGVVSIKKIMTPITSLNGANGRKYMHTASTPTSQTLLTRTVSTPQIFTPNRRTIPFSTAHKGLMQRFIASRGKIALKNNNSNNTNIMNGNGNGCVPQYGITPHPAAQVVAALNNTMIPDFGGGVRNSAVNYVSEVPRSSPIIERGSDGKPIRRGYVPVEEKIQKELQDLKSRESELKKIRKIRQSTPDLLDSIDNENLESEEEDEDEVEHCYGPGKLRSAKSISELCDSANSNNSMSSRTTPSPDFNSKHYLHRGGGSGMRPAVSLAQLCDLDPEEAPSSHRLIAQWENLIQQNA